LENEPLIPETWLFAPRNKKLNPPRNWPKYCV